MKTTDLVPLVYYAGNGIKIEASRQPESRQRWAIRRVSNECLNKYGYWEYEPSPSSRDTSFIQRCRFDTVEDALDALNKKESYIHMIGETIKADEETRLKCAHYRQEFERIATVVNNVLRCNYSDPEDFKTDLKNLVTQLQQFLTV